MVKKSSIYKKILFAVWVIGIVVFSIFPFLQMLSTSLKYSWDWGNPSLIPQKFNFDRYIEILNLKPQKVDMSAVPKNIQLLLQNPELTEAHKQAIISKFIDTSNVFSFKRYFLNSFLISGGASFLALCIAVFGSYAISRLRFPGKKIMSRSVLLVYMFGGILLLIPLYRIAGLFGLLSTPAGVITALVIVYVIQTLPVSLYMLGNYFRSIPYSIEESAIIDGASRVKIVFKIIIPLAISAIITVYIYVFVIAWNEYLFASVFLKAFPNLHTLPLGLRTVFVSKNAVWDLVMAASVLTTVPIIIIFMFIQKGLIRGLTSGSVKE